MGVDRAGHLMVLPLHPFCSAALNTGGRATLAGRQISVAHLYSDGPHAVPGRLCVGFRTQVEYSDTPLQAEPRTLRMITASRPYDSLAESDPCVDIFQAFEEDLLRSRLSPVSHIRGSQLPRGLPVGPPRQAWDSFTRQAAMSLALCMIVSGVWLHCLLQTIYQYGWLCQLIPGCNFR